LTWFGACSTVKWDERSEGENVKPGLIALTLFVVLHPAPGFSQEQSPARFSWFESGHRAVDILRADPTEARFRFGVMFDKDSRFLEDLAVGGDLGIIRISFQDGSFLSLNARGVLTSRFEFGSESFDLLDVDFVGGPALGYRSGDWSVGMWINHRSAHLGDEVLERGDRERIDFSLEEIRTVADYRLGSFRIYGGVRVVVHAWPEELLGRTTLQLGGEWSGRSMQLPLYLAFDGQLRLDDPDLTGLSLQFGVELGCDECSSRCQSLFLEGFTGRSHLGQFHQERERYVMFGFLYPFL
jgi:hypothetical protein